MPLIEPAGSPSQASGKPSKQSKPANRIVAGRRSTKYFSQLPLLVPSSRTEPSGASAMIQLIATFQIGRLPVCLLNVGTMIARGSSRTLSFQNSSKRSVLAISEGTYRGGRRHRRRPSVGQPTSEAHAAHALDGGAVLRGQPLRRVALRSSSPRRASASRASLLRRLAWHHAVGPEGSCVAGNVVD